MDLRTVDIPAMEAPFAAGFVTAAKVLPAAARPGFDPCQPDAMMDH
jgi:hypothetical protein